MSSQGQVASHRINSEQLNLSAAEARKKKRHMSAQWNAAQAKKNSPRYASILYVLLDLLSVCIAAALAYQVRLVAFRSSLSPEALRQEHRAYLGFFLVYAILIVLAGQSLDLYRDTTRVPIRNESREILKGV